MATTTVRPTAPETAAAHDDIEQHSLPATIAYHLLPGLLILAVTLAAIPLVTAAGLPPIAALFLAFVVAQLPVQLGHLLRLGRRRNGRWSLTGVVGYRRPLPRWQYPLLVLGIVAWSWLVYFPLAPVSTALLNTVFAWVPRGFALDAAGFAGYPRPALLVTLSALLLVNGLVGPIVEELYFRGYLLPRLSRFGGRAPLDVGALPPQRHRRRGNRRAGLERDLNTATACPRAQRAIAPACRDREEPLGGTMASRRRAMEYRSEHVWGDLPVVHVSVGGRQADGRYRLGRARGIIALGDIATGLVAVGGVAIGLFSAGGVAIGLVALGGVAIGLVAVGGVSIGLVAIGAVAMGLTAVGALTVGLVGAGPRPRLAARLGGRWWRRTATAARARSASKRRCSATGKGLRP